MFWKIVGVSLEYKPPPKMNPPFLSFGQRVVPQGTGTITNRHILHWFVPIRTTRSVDTKFDHGHWVAGEAKGSEWFPKFMTSASEEGDAVKSVWIYTFYKTKKKKMKLIHSSSLRHDLTFSSACAEEDDDEENMEWLHQGKVHEWTLPLLNLLLFEKGQYALILHQWLMHRVRKVRL